MLVSKITLIRKGSLFSAIGSSLLLCVGASFISVFLTGAIVQITGSLLGLELVQTTIYLILLTVIVVGYLGAWIKSGLVRECRIDKTRMFIKRWTGQMTILDKQDIQKVRWKKNTFVFDTKDAAYAVTMPNWAMTNLLFYWLPEHLLALEIQGSIKEAKEIAQSPPPIFKEVLKVGRSRDIFSGLIELSNEGIGRSSFMERKFLLWNEIEVVEIGPRRKAFKLWKNGRYTRFRLTFLSTTEQEVILSYFLEQIYTRGIPICHTYPQ